MCSVCVCVCVCVCVFVFVCVFVCVFLFVCDQGRMLSLFAQYYRYTRDSETLLKYFDKIQGIVTMLNGRRSQSQMQPPGPARGMPVGHDEADLFVTWAQENPSGNHTTELPFYSIAAEFWRGLVDLGNVWVDIGNASHATSTGATAGSLMGNITVAAAGRAMLAEAPSLLQNLRSSMMATHALAAAEVNGSQCWPYVAGRTQCAELEQQSSNRDSEPWRTYAEMAWSGALLPDTLTDIIAWNRNNAKSMKGGMMSGTGSDASGNNLMTFTGTEDQNVFLHPRAFPLVQARCVWRSLTCKLVA